MLKNLASNFSKSALFTLPFTANLSSMAKNKTIPAPTVPTAIKSREAVEGGKIESGTEYATFAGGCFVRFLSLL
jgi:hypothetical protein